MSERLRAIGLRKVFTLHNQNAAQIPVLTGFDLAVAAGECVVLNGPSGAGKSTVLRALFGNYLVDEGHVLIAHCGGVVDLTQATARVVLDRARAACGVG
jgi:alpha-D-ribose 1-methylphosphonate 5-triphosphate synthase subunit PhnL